MSKFFVCQQINSGGAFGPPAVNVLIQAETVEAAEQLVSKHIQLCHDTGHYADFDECGCCPCCGHRWGIRQWALDSARAVGLIGEATEYMGAVNAALIRSDGELIVGADRERHAEILGVIRSESNP